MRTWLVCGLAGLVLAQSEKRPATMRPVVYGRQHAVSSMRPEASLAAERILRRGGNAFDAAVAGQAVLGVTDAPNNGIGGDAEILVYDAGRRQVVSINAEGTAPRLATIDWYERNQGGKIPDSDTLLAATAPGVVDAWYLLLDRWGTMTFAEVLEPAIEMAERGVPIPARMASAINNSKKLGQYPTSVATYRPDGKVWRAGELYTNRNLARTMRRLVEAERAAREKGAGAEARRAGLRAARDLFYRGAMAREMAEFAERNGGLFRYEDFAGYEAKIEEAVAIDYRGYRVYKNPSATQGPAELFALGILKGYDLRALGHNTAEAIHTAVEAVKLAFADREKYLGDWLFIRIPFEGLLAEEYFAERRGLIDPRRASLEYRPGVAERYAPGFPPVERPGEVNLKPAAPDEGDTSYLAVVDRERNAVSFTPSLHSGFGTNIVMGDLGFSFNCRGDYFSLTRGHANALEPGKRPRSTLQSTIATREGRLWLVTGSPGGDDQCLRTMQTLINIADYGMNVQQAIEAPRWSTRSFPQSVFPHPMYAGEVTVEERIGEEVRAELRRRGHRLKVGGAWSLGMNAAILVAGDGVLHAGADPRYDAYAIAW